MTPNRKLPLAGCRVLDLGIITAGAATSALLADAGAEVIKIESASYPDPFRFWSSGDPDAKQTSSPVFEFTNRNKDGLALDLKRPEGRAVFLQLVAKSDAVVENFRRGVMEGLGLDFARLRAVNPRIVLGSISSQGETGPTRLFTSYGSTLEATGGLAAITGYPDGPPAITGRNVNYPDQLVGVFAMGAIVTAMLHARRSGEGAHVDIAQREVTTFVIGEHVTAASRAAEPVPGQRRGNADPGGRPQGCFAAADGRWVAVTVLDGAGLPADLRADEVSLRAWIAARTAQDAVQALTGHGIAAAIVRSSAEVLAETPVGDGGALARSPAGVLVKGFPFRSARTPFGIVQEAPAVGRDSEAVLRRVLDIDPVALATLRELGVLAGDA